MKAADPEARRSLTLWGGSINGRCRRFGAAHSPARVWPLSPCKRGCSSSPRMELRSLRQAARTKVHQHGWRRVYGRELEPDQGYVETDEGTRLLLELAIGIIAEVLGEPKYDDARPPERRERRKRRGVGIDIPPGHYPPPGSCRFWFPDRPPGQQPPPGGLQRSRATGRCPRRRVTGRRNRRRSGGRIRLRHGTGCQGSHCLGSSEPATICRDGAQSR